MKYVLPKYKPYRHSIRVVLVASLLLNSLFVQSIRAETEKALRVLPPMTVFVTRRPDKTVVQRSEVEWHLSNDPTIIIESDGTYTAGDTTKPYSLKSLIESTGSPAVNLNISYAKNSISMTADGRLVLSTLIEALDHLDEGTTIQLTPINSPVQESKSITQRRVNSLRDILQRSKGINLKIMPSKTLKTTTPKSKQTNYWRIRIRRERL